MPEGMDSAPADDSPPIGAFPQSRAAPDERMAATGVDAEWFQRLSPKLQQEYRDRWDAAVERDRERHRTRLRSFAWGAGRGALAFLVTHLMFGGIGWELLYVPLAGALLGLAWTWFDFGPMKSLISAGPVYALVYMAADPSRPYLRCGRATVRSDAATSSAAARARSA
jgi:hypothetical protein